MTDKKLSSEELQQLLEKDKAERMLSCKSEIEAILRKHKCQLVALPMIKIEGAMWVGTTEVQLKAL